MGTPQDASSLNNVTVGTGFIYSVNSASVSSAGTNGTNTYSGSVSTSGQSGLSGTFTDTSSNGNGSVSLTSASGMVTNYLVLGSSQDGKNLVVQTYDPSTGSTGPYYLIANSGTQPTSSVSFNSNNPYASPTCFMTGTYILTDIGEVAVERLKIGDLVRTRDNGLKPIIWIGCQFYDCTTYIKPNDVTPIIIKKDSIADCIPSRDTFLSSGHGISVLLDNGPFLIPIHKIVNGNTIKYTDFTKVEYWHIELESHETVFANGLASETYFDCGNRSSFTEIDKINNDHISDQANIQIKHADESQVLTIIDTINRRSVLGDHQFLLVAA